jgi:hypothetical protein
MELRQKILMFSIALTALCAMGAGASQIRQIEWSDLQQKIEFEDPFKNLSEEQLLHLGTYVRIEKLKENQPQRVTPAMQAEVDEGLRFLESEGVDVQGLLAKRAEITELRRQQGTAVVTELDGKQIRMPGFALPLEYSDKKITEFLLVPWVGACIHTPPPPPNQIVYVKVDKGFETNGMFEPIWVSGELVVKPLTKNLYLKDGSADIGVGYTLIANSISAYQK